MVGTEETLGTIVKKGMPVTVETQRTEEETHLLLKRSCVWSLIYLQLPINTDVTTLQRERWEQREHWENSGDRGNTGNTIATVGTLGKTRNGRNRG